MRRIELTAALAAAALVFGACKGPATTSPSGSEAAGTPTAATTTAAAPSIKEGGTLVVALSGDILSADPAFSGDENSTYVQQNVMEGLVSLAPGTSDKIIPTLATSLPTVSDSGRTYTFPLRQGVKFHDGTDFNAAAVKFNYDRWNALPTALQNYAVYAGEVFGGFGSASNIASVDVIDPYTVVLHLKVANSGFLLTQTVAPFEIASPAALKAGGADNTVTDIKKISFANGGTGAMVGTGPFKFKEWVPGDHVTIVKNPDYWDANGKAHLDQVIFKAVSDDAQILAGLQRNEFDLARILAPQDVATVKSNPALQNIDRGQGSCNEGQIEFNQAYAPVNNVLIRQAIAYAVNKQSNVDAFFNGQAIVAENWAPLNFKYVKPLDLPKYDPAMAKTLIAQSGETNLSIDFYYPSNIVSPYMPDAKGEFEAITRDLEAVGLKIIPHTETWRPDYLDHKSVGKFAMFLFGNNCDWAGIDDFLSYAFFGYVGGAPRQEFNYKNDLLNKTMNDALAAQDDATAQKLWDQAGAILKADMPAVPLLYSVPAAGAQVYVKGFIGSAVQNEYLNTVWLNK
jgi:peptide/nickel transport system substrate-binding protein